MTTDVLHHDRYRVEEMLGTGAMGTVLLAHDNVLDRRVAVKVLADNLAAHDDFRQRFLREARLAARLCHPNIVQVFDAGENGRPFLVMEYVEGKTVADRLACGLGFSGDEVLALATDLSAGLAHAHAMGIVHRDVKPHNVLVGPDGVSKLTDFGIARALEDHGLTEVGTVLGTAQFMAPEQAAGEPAGPPADVFALGAVLRYVAGPRPLPGSLEPLVEAALASDPAARPSAAAIHARLTESPSDTDPTVIVPIAATQIRRPAVAGETERRSEISWRRPAVIGLAALTVILLLLAVFPRGNGNESTTPVPAGADASQSARNLATWLRDQADDGAVPTTGAPR